MIKTIIFDNNGVLTSSDSEDNSARLLGVEKSVFKPIWEETAKSLDDGRITTKEFHKEILDHFGIKKDLNELREVHLGSFSLKEEIMEFAESLMDHYELALFTNFGDAFDECNEKWRMEKIFGDNLFVSCKMRMRKPNDDIYIKVLEDLRRKPEETIFIDDNKENIKAANNLGINDILFTDLEKLKKDLGKYITI